MQQEYKKKQAKYLKANHIPKIVKKIITENILKDAKNIGLDIEIKIMTYEELIQFTTAQVKIVQ